MLYQNTMSLESSQAINHQHINIGLSDDMLLFSPPVFEYGTINAEEFRENIIKYGAVLLRNAVDVELLQKINNALLAMFETYAKMSDAEFEECIKNAEPDERVWWEQAKLSHIYERTFVAASGLSYFDIIRNSALWNLTKQAWPELVVSESHNCTCRRMFCENKSQRSWAAPIEFHVDAQFHNDEKFILNFWTPLNPCGVTAPGLKVILLGMEATKAYLEYNPEGYEKGPEDIAWMHKFKCKKMKSTALEENGILKYAWAPTLNLGDILVFDNFAMHASHVNPDMIESRTSIEVRVNLD